MTTMSQNELDTLFADPVAQRLLSAAIPARMAYTSRDGSPRVVPISWGWEDPHLLMWTTPNAPKVRALQRDPRVAVTLDTNDFPPNILLIRGTAALELVDGVPQGYLDAGHKNVDDEHYDEWVAGVRGLYDQMVTIRVTPAWAKILDFETRIPSAVEELVKEKQAAG
jgi:Pyridoxamine 5'-phosphate oxidase